MHKHTLTHTNILESHIAHESHSFSCIFSFCILLNTTKLLLTTQPKEPTSSWKPWTFFFFYTSPSKLNRNTYCLCMCVHRYFPKCCSLQICTIVHMPVSQQKRKSIPFPIQSSALPFSQSKSPKGPHCPRPVIALLSTASVRLYCALVTPLQILALPFWSHVFL